MAGSSPTGFRDLATGFLSGFAALATAIAGVVGVLHETGYIGSHTAVAPVVVATSATMSHPAPAASVSVASSSNAPAMPAVTSGVAQKPSASIQEHRRPRAHRSVSPGYAVAAIAPGAAPAVAPPREIPRAESTNSEESLVTLSGAWTDFGPGYCHTIKQAGDKFEVVNFAPITGSFISVGHGTISGRSIQLHLNDLHPAAAMGELYLSEDGQKLVGTLRRPDGEHPMVWHRKGAPCG